MSPEMKWEGGERGERGRKRGRGVEGGGREMDGG